jgi:hypothetical protein
MYRELSIISGTGADIWSKSNFGPPGRYHPWSSPHPHVCTVPSTSAIFKHPGNCVLWGCSALPAILSWSCHLCQSGVLSVLPSIWEIGESSRGPSQESRMGGGGQSCFFWVKKDVWNSALPWCNNQAVCCQSLGQSLCTFSHSRHKTSVYAELTVWLARGNSFWIIPMMSRKMMSMLLTLLVNCLAFFLSRWVWTFFPKHLSNYYQGLHHIFAVWSITKSQ